MRPIPYALGSLAIFALLYVLMSPWAALGFAIVISFAAVLSSLMSRER